MLSAPSRLRVLHALLFVSGASGLVFEIVWLRALGLSFGNTVPALTAVLAAFMGGLALGGLALGRAADRAVQPLRLYLLLEAGIGISGALVSLLLLRAPGAVLPLARAVAESPGLRAGLFVLLLLVPTTLMGGTVPVLARAFTSAGLGGRTVGTLYAVNTAGAVLGALLPDALLIPNLGLTQTALCAAAANLVIALVASRLVQPGEPATPAAAAPPAPLAPLLFAASGFCAMGYEVVWSRLLEHLTAGLVVGFSVLLAVYLVAVAAGARLCAPFADRARRPLWLAALLLIGSGAAATLPLWPLQEWVALVGRLLPADPAVAREAPWQAHLVALLHSLYLEGGACFLMGAALPFLAAGGVRAGSAGRESGQLNAANTLAGVAGAAAAGLFLLPRLGTQATLAGLSLLAILAGAFGAAALGKGAVARAAPAVAAALLVLLGASLPAGHLRSILFPYPAADALAIEEGTTTSVAVVVHRRFGQELFRELRTPGVSMSSTSPPARRYMGMMGHLPLFFAARPTDALLICFGVGNTARSLLSHAELERLDVADLAPEVIAQSPLFAAVAHGDPLRDPRTRVFIDDGRHHLLTSGRRYDAITSEPPPPNHAGVVNLYSREYYAAAKAALKPGGVLTQWLPIFQLAAEETLAMVAAAQAEFAQVLLFDGIGDQLILVASKGPLVLDLAEWERRAAAPAVAADLRWIGVDGASALAGSMLQDDAGLRAASAGVQPVTDDLPVIQYPSRELRWPSEVPPGLIGAPRAVLSLLRGGNGGPVRDLERAADAQALATRAQPLALLAPPEYQELVYGSLLRGALALEPGSPWLRSLLGLDDDALAAAEAALRLDPRRADAGLLLAASDYYRDDFDSARRRLLALSPGPDEAARYWLLRGGAERASGALAEASSSFARAAQASGSQPFRAHLAELAKKSAAPWRPEGGPLALQHP